MRHKAFAEFYRIGTHYDGSERFVTAVGDRSVLILDGRTGDATRHAHAREWARKHGFAGYRLCRGTFTNPFYLTAAVQEV